MEIGEASEKVEEDAEATLRFKLRSYQALHYQILAMEDHERVRLKL